MDRIAALQAFVRVVELKSFSAAAEELRVRQSTVSKWLASLEDEMSARLVERTTRSQRITDAGRLLYERSKEILAAYEDVSTQIQRSDLEPRGRIRVSAPVVFGTLMMLGPVAKFLRRNAGIEIEMVLSDRYVNLLEEGFDVAIRVGVPIDSTLRARVLGGTPRRVVASPGYLQRHGTPKAPEDLREHQCLLHTSLGAGNVWAFRRSGKLHRTRVRGRFAANNSDALMQMARAGVGIAVLASWLVDSEIRSGRLIELLTAYELPSAPIQALTAPGRSPHPRVRSFIDAVADGLG